MKKKYLLVPAFALFAVLGAGAASAHWGMGGWGSTDPETTAQRFQEQMSRDATMLGIGVDEVKNAWAQGKTIKDIASEKGITDEQLREKMQAAREEEMKQMLQILVEKGQITQDQADARLKVMQEKVQNNEGKGGHKGMRGDMGMGMMGGRLF